MARLCSTRHIRAKATRCQLGWLSASQQYSLRPTLLLTYDGIPCTITHDLIKSNIQDNMTQSSGFEQRTGMAGRETVRTN